MLEGVLGSYGLAEKIGHAATRFHTRTRKNHGRIDAVLLYYPATENPFPRWGAQDAASDAVVRDLTVTYRDVRVSEVTR